MSSHHRIARSTPQSVEVVCSMMALLIGPQYVPCLSMIVVYEVDILRRYVLVFVEHGRNRGRMARMLMRADRRRWSLEYASWKCTPDQSDSVVFCYRVSAKAKAERMQRQVLGKSIIAKNYCRSGKVVGSCQFRMECKSYEM
jgi:hypothetical protein